MSTEQIKKGIRVNLKSSGFIDMLKVDEDTFIINQIKGASGLFFTKEEMHEIIGCLCDFTLFSIPLDTTVLNSLVNEKDCRIKNLITQVKTDEESIKQMGNTIRKIRESFDSLKDERDMYKCACENADSELVKYKKTLEGKDLRIDEYKKQLEKAHTQINILSQQKDSKPNKWRKKYKELKKMINKI